MNSEMKVKVNLVNDKPKYKLMNLKGKKFKKLSHSSSFKQFNLPPSNPKPLSRRSMEDYASL